MSMSVLLSLRYAVPSLGVTVAEMRGKLSGVCVRRFSATAKTMTEKTERSENDQVNIKFTNRNPKNLEQMNLGRKRKGWLLQYPSYANFYHRVQFEATNRHTSAMVEHCTGKTIISASTKEFAIAKHLYSLTDYCAALNIGRVLARRCLEAGVNRTTILAPLQAENSHKFDAFVSALEDGGLDLTEGQEIIPEYEPGIDYDDEESLGELYDRQARVANISEVHLKIKELRKRRHHAGSNWTVPPIPVPLTPVKEWNTTRKSLKMVRHKVVEEHSSE